MFMCDTFMYYVDNIEDHNHFPVSLFTVVISYQGQLNAVFCECF